MNSRSFWCAVSSLASPFDLYKARRAAGALLPDAGQEAAIVALEDVFQSLTASQDRIPTGWLARLTGKRPDAPTGLYMYGGVGRGKTMLMDLFFSALPPEIPKWRVHFHAFMLAVQEELHALRRRSDSGKVDNSLPTVAAGIAARAKVLCFDEFQVTDIADAMILGRLFTALFGHGVVVIATSNRAPDHLYEGGLQRDLFLPFIDLLKARTRTIALDGAVDYRDRPDGESDGKDGRWFRPLGSASAAAAERALRYVTGLPAGAFQPEDLALSGRVLPVMAAGEAGWTSFSELCERPRGAEDYLALAARFKTVLIEGVPKLGYDRRNEARRFIHLIDALYDGRVRLLVTAETTPDRLYVGHDHAFEFERTLSRLTEMMDPAWPQPQEKVA